MSEFRYLKEKARMLKFLGRNGYCTRDICKKCRLSAAGEQHQMSCETFEIEYPEEAEAIVRKWAEEHPRKTRKEVLLEKFPNAKMDERGTPYACTVPLGIISECHFRKEDGEDCRACWNIEVEE